MTVQANCRIFTGVHCFLSPSLCVHTDDMDSSEGLCGNYNNIGADDLIPRDWTSPDTNYAEPVLFSSSYM